MGCCLSLSVSFYHSVLPSAEQGEMLQNSLHVFFTVSQLSSVTMVLVILGYNSNQKVIFYRNTWDNG